MRNKKCSNWVDCCKNSDDLRINPGLGLWHSGQGAGITCEPLFKCLLCFWCGSLLTCPGKQQQMAQPPGSLSPHGRPSRSFWLLALDWPSASCCSHQWSEHGTCLCLPFSLCVTLPIKLWSFISGSKILGFLWEKEAFAVRDQGSTQDLSSKYFSFFLGHWKYWTLRKRQVLKKYLNSEKKKKKRKKGGRKKVRLVPQHWEALFLDIKRTLAFTTSFSICALSL